MVLELRDDGCYTNMKSVAEPMVGCSRSATAVPAGPLTYVSTRLTLDVCNYSNARQWLVSGHRHQLLMASDILGCFVHLHLDGAVVPPTKGYDVNLPHPQLFGAG